MIQASPGNNRTEKSHDSAVVVVVDDDDDDQVLITKTGRLSSVLSVRFKKKKNRPMMPA